MAHNEARWAVDSVKYFNRRHGHRQYILFCVLIAVASYVSGNQCYVSAHGIRINSYFRSMQIMLWSIMYS